MFCCMRQKIQAFKDKRYNNKDYSYNKDYKLFTHDLNLFLINIT